MFPWSGMKLVTALYLEAGESAVQNHFTTFTQGLVQLGTLVHVKNPGYSLQTNVWGGLPCYQ